METPTKPKKNFYASYLQDSMGARQGKLEDRREALTARLLAAKDEATRLQAAKNVSSPVVSGGGKSALTNVNLKSTKKGSLATPKASGKMGTKRYIPTSGYGAITNPYGKPNARYSAGYHTGIDYGTARGTKVGAAAGGTVTYASSAGAYGKHIKIKHADGHTTLYAHLDSINVKVGQKVKGNYKIGTVGSSGTSTGPHLHFELRTGAGGYSDVTNPSNWLRGR